MVTFTLVVAALCLECVCGWVSETNVTLPFPLMWPTVVVVTPQLTSHQPVFHDTSIGQRLLVLGGVSKNLNSSDTHFGVIHHRIALLADHASRSHLVPVPLMSFAGFDSFNIGGNSSEDVRSMLAALDFEGLILQWRDGELSWDPGVAGPTAFVSSSSGHIFFVSMCAFLESLPFTLTTNVVLRLNPSSGVFEQYWSGGTHIVRNASCVALPIPETPSQRLYEDVIAILGGTREGDQIPTGGIVIDMLRLGEDGRQTKYLEQVVTLPVMESDTFVQWPLVAATSSEFLVVGAGEYNTGSGFAPCYSMFSVALFVAAPPQFSALYGLASFLRKRNGLPFTDALFMFGTKVIFSNVHPDAGGIVAWLDLAWGDALASQWQTAQLPGPDFGYIGSTFAIRPLYRGEGLTVCIDAVGGVPLTNASTMGRAVYSKLPMSEISRAQPASLVVPYHRYASTQVDSSRGTVTVSVVIFHPREGLLALSDTPSCRNRHGERGYSGQDTVDFILNISDALYLSETSIYVCYATQGVVAWPTNIGRTVITRLYDCINPTQPLLLEMPTPAPLSPPPRFTEEKGFYVILALGVLTFLAFVVIGVSAVRHFTQSKWSRAKKKARRRKHSAPTSGSDQVFFEESADDFFARLQISNNTHAKRYELLKSLTQTGEDDVMANHHTFLVRRHSDKSLLAMKYYRCDTDLERLSGMHEFELLQMLQGHPHTILLVDMFMSYTFGDAKPQLTLSSPLNKTPQSQRRYSDNSPTDPLLTADPNSYNTLNSEAEERTERSHTLPTQQTIVMPRSSSSNSLSNSRYLCIVMEYHPLGNIRAWCHAHASQQRFVDEDVCASAAPEQAILSVCEQLLNLLAYMHDEFQPPVLHQGLKPENILVTAAPSPANVNFLPIVVSDFGLSDLGRYAPPLLETEEFNDKDDIWCVGCVLLSMGLMLFGDEFPDLGKLLSGIRRSAYQESVFKDIEQDLMSRGYSRELGWLIRALLRRDRDSRPSASRALQWLHRINGNMLVLHMDGSANGFGVA